MTFQEILNILCHVSVVLLVLRYFDHLLIILLKTMIEFPETISV